MDPANIFNLAGNLRIQIWSLCPKSGFRNGAAKIGNNSCKNQAIVMIFLNKYTPRKGD